MKTFRWLLVAMTALTLSLVACEKAKPEPKPEPEPDPQPTELTFDIEVLDVAKTDVTFSITPSNLEADYMVMVFDAKSVEAYSTDAELIAKAYADLKSYAEANGTTFDAFMAEKVKRGALENHTVENLNVATKYYILAFGVDAENSYAVSSEIFKQNFETEENNITPSSCTFEVKSTVHLTNAALSVKPSDNAQLWHLVNVPVDEYQTYTSAEGEYGWTKEEYFQNYLNTEITTLKEQNLSNEEIGIKLFHTGARTLNASGLAPKTKYVVFVAAVDYADGAAYVTSALKEVRYNSGEAAANDLTFDIDVYNISNYSAEVRITPSNPDANYYYYVSYIDSQKKSMKPIDIANSAVTEYIYYWENYTELKHRDPVQGVVELTGENKLELNIAETEYYIVAFSFEPNPTYGTVLEETGEYDTNPGTITSAPVYVSFMTAEQGDPRHAAVTFRASDVGPYGFNLGIEASDPTIYYQPGIAYAENFNPQAALDASSPLLAQLVQMTMEGQSPSLTFWEALEEKLYNYYRNGDGKYYIANLEPNREYIGYVLAIDVETRKFARCIYSDVIATTTNPGSVTPQVELLGVYNGEHEAGTIFGDKELTSGRPIVAVKLKNIENASAAYAALSTDPYADVAALSDRYIISEFRGYWQTLTSLAVPYHFFIAEWDMEQTVVAYAQDANGHEAGVGRLGVTPVSAGDIEELRGYVDAVNNNAEPQALTKSLVIAEVAEPTMECIWSEEVGAPRAAEVTYHAVEPIAVASDVMMLSTVMSIRF